MKGDDAGGLLYSDDDVEMGKYQIPENWDLATVVDAITTVRPEWGNERKTGFTHLSFSGRWLLPPEGCFLGGGHPDGQGEDPLPQPGREDPRVSYLWFGKFYKFYIFSSDHRPSVSTTTNSIITSTA